MANVSIDGVIYSKKQRLKITKPGLLYHFGERVLTGVKTGSLLNPAIGRPVNFLNSYASLGLYMQTGAWERSNNKNLGITWLAFRYILCYTNPERIKEFLPTNKTNGTYKGYSIAWGVEISKLVNIKIVYYDYIKKPEIEYYLPLYQFSFNYSIK